MEQQGSISEFESDSSAKPSSSSSSPSLEDILKLLRGQTDSQRMAGLFLVTKFCNTGDQLHTILEIYRALDPNFLLHLLLTGMGKGTAAGRCDDANRDTYLRLSVTVLSAFDRISQIASTEQMLAKFPLFLEILSERSNSSIFEECYEFLLLVSTAHEDGAITLFKSGGMNVLASQMPTLQDGSHAMELAMRLVQLTISKLPGETVYVEHPHELSKMVTTIAKQFAVLHNALKFEALHLLSNILSSNYSVALHGVLQSMVVDNWSTYLRIGVVDVLQNRVAPEEKLQALVLAESVISIIGEDWLIGPITLPAGKNSSRADLCILLVLESSRVEIDVLLNELAYLKYEDDKNSSTNAETFLVKLRNLGVAFALVERIIKLVAKFGESEESNSNSIITEGTFSKILGGLDETIGVILDYLQEAKEHGQKKGDDLLASVRVVGSYLAEAPDACREKVGQLLGYMLSVEGDDEPSSSYSICFLLPMLCQITMTSDGCKMVAFTGAFRPVFGHLISLIDSSSCKIEDDGTILLACDTIMNFLLKMGNAVVIADAFGGSLPPGISGTNDRCTALVSNLSPDRIDEDKLFNLFSLYGNIIRIKLLRNKPDHALVQMSDGFQAELAVHFLKGAMLFGKRLEVNFSKHSIITAGADTHDYSNSNLNRFNRNAVKNYRYCCSPTKMIHISTLPPDVTEDEIVAHLEDCGTIVSVKLFEMKGKKQVLVLFENEEQATEALVWKHATSLGGSTIRISFSQLQTI